METRTASPKQVNLLVAAPVISLVSIAAVETVSRLASAPCKWLQVSGKSKGFPG